MLGLIMEDKQKVIPFEVYAEATPNPLTLKFVANKLLVDGEDVYEFKNADEAAEWPVAVELFKLPFVEAVFIAANYIAVSRQQDVEWNGITMELRQLIRDYLNSGREIRATGGGRALGKDEDETPGDEVE
ncbi:MAG: NifU N-terminal domain-containing protein, partial [Flavobacteriales bacterium]